jgi:ABC-2 type transport system permease protein
MFSHFQHPLLKLLPNYWVSDSMYWFLKGNTTAVFRYSALLFFTAGLLLAANYGVAASFYFKSYHIAQTVKLRREGKSGKEKLSVVNFFKPWKRYPVTAVMLRKETALFFRDVSHVAQLSVMSLLIILFVSSVSGRPHVLFLSLNPELQTVIYLVFFLFNSFLITSIALRFVYPLQSLEGETFWRLRSAPLDYRSIVYGRFIAYFILLVTIALGLAIFSHRRFHPFLLMYSSLIMFFVTLTVCALNYSFGMYFADYKEKNPVRIASSQGASTAFLVCLLYLGVVIGVMFVPLYEFFLATRNLNQSPTFSGFLLSGGGIIFLSLIVTGVCFRLTRRYAEVDLV